MLMWLRTVFKWLFCIPDPVSANSRRKEQLSQQTLSIKRRILLGEDFPHGRAIWENENGKTHEVNLRMAIESNLLQLAIDSKGRLVGYLAAKPSSLGPAIAEITDFYVLPGFRGKSQGVGKGLLKNTLEKLEQYGYQEVFLGTVPEFKRAIALYESYGFKKRTVQRFSGPENQGNLVYTEDKLTFEMVRVLKSLPDTHLIPKSA
jgi:ribosomal protein S18 acetylase RimI-like enzyme